MERILICLIDYSIGGKLQMRIFTVTYCRLVFLNQRKVYRTHSIKEIHTKIRYIIMKQY